MSNKLIFDFVASFILLLLAITICQSNGGLQQFQFSLQNLTDEQRDELFSYLDADKNLTLNESEYHLLLQSLFLAQNISKFQPTVQKLFILMDFNHNGSIDKQEFDQIWKEWILVILRPKSALIVVDVQNDFIDVKGSLAVPNAMQMIPTINQLIATINFAAIVYTHDWHPSNHCSFVENFNMRDIIDYSPSEQNRPQTDPNNGEISQEINPKMGDIVTYAAHPDVKQVLWPKHCVQNTFGANLYKDLLERNSSRIDIFKGTNPDVDSYSAFSDNGHLQVTDLNDKLLSRNITDVYLSGVAYDFCVGSTAKDALNLGYRTVIVEDATTGVIPRQIDLMKNTLYADYATIVNSSEVWDLVNAKDRRIEMSFVLAKKLYDKQNVFQNPYVKQR